jgi:uncharacterized protein (DUF486 family)
MKTVALLLVSNIFMTIAWYGHLKFKSTPLWTVIIVSWLIAFFEYCFQVPANRIGHYQFTAAQLKTIQEVITLLVFSVFSVVYLKEELKWNYMVGFMMIIVAVFFIFKKW